jgi:hypothetical protein
MAPFAQHVTPPYGIVQEHGSRTALLHSCRPVMFVALARFCQELQSTGSRVLLLPVQEFSVAPTTKTATASTSERAILVCASPINVSPITLRNVSPTNISFRTRIAFGCRISWVRLCPDYYLGKVSWAPEQRQPPPLLDLQSNLPPKNRTQVLPLFF